MRTIDADRLAKRIQCLIRLGHRDAFDCLDEIDAAPTIDAVEVVRCKDCMFYGWEQDPCHGRVERFCKLHKGLVVVNKETFCSYGDRRDDEAD